MLLANVPNRDRILRYSEKYVSCNYVSHNSYLVPVVEKGKQQTPACIDSSNTFALDEEQRYNLSITLEKSEPRQIGQNLKPKFVKHKFVNFILATDGIYLQFLQIMTSLVPLHTSSYRSERVWLRNSTLKKLTLSSNQSQRGP